MVAPACEGLFYIIEQPIQTVSVRGEFTPSECEQIESILTPVVSQGVLSASLEVLRERMDQLPWAQDLSLRRIWPDTIEVVMHRTTPIARWGQDKYVGPSGQLLVTVQDYPDLPQFDVAIDSPESALQHYRLLAQIFARERLQVMRLRQSELGEWDVVLHKADAREQSSVQMPEEHDPAIQVFLGDAAISERAHRVLKFYRRILLTQDRAVKYLDARYSSGLAVKYESDTLLADSGLTDIDYPIEVGADSGASKRSINVRRGL